MDSFELNDEWFEPEPQGFDPAVEIRGPSRSFGEAAAKLHKTTQRLGMMVAVLMVMVLIVVAGAGILWVKINNTEAQVRENCISRTAAVKIVVNESLRPFVPFSGASPEQKLQTENINAQKVARLKGMYGDGGSLANLKC